jgi:16S rRNA processing protein RimM
MSDHPSIPPEPAPAAGGRRQRQEPPASATANEEWVTIGRIVALFGLRGEVKVIPQTDIPDRFSQLHEVYLGPEHQRRRISKASPYKGTMLRLGLAGIDSANAAEPLIGQEITIPLAQLPTLPADQYYIHDLIGLRVESSSGQTLGVIADILATGANDVYVVRETGAGREVLVPAVKEMVRRVDIAAGVVVIDPLPGLFDDRFEEAL